jgi:hypothetical protein
MVCIWGYVMWRYGPVAVSDIFFYHGRTVLVGLGLHEVPQSDSLVFLWASDRPVAETST